MQPTEGPLEAITPADDIEGGALVIDGIQFIRIGLEPDRALYLPKKLVHARSTDPDDFLFALRDLRTRQIAQDPLKYRKTIGRRV